MNTTSSARSTMRSIVPESPDIVKGTKAFSVVKYYLNTESVLFSCMCDEKITRAQVLLSNLIVVLMALAVMFAEGAPLLSLAATTAASYLVSLVKGKEADNE